MIGSPYRVSRTPQIILALDVDNFEKAKHFINILYPKIKIFKVGYQLFTICGAKIVEFIHKKGAEVFLDLKFHDIPNTVANAARQATRLKVKMFTLHISGGKTMLQRAVEAAADESRQLKIKPPFLLGVTVLTSQDAQPGDVLKLARLGLECGLDGIVCSVEEAGYLRKRINQDFYIITPGIRPTPHPNPLLKGERGKGEGDDQKRIATPKQAAEAGSDFLVIGRPILEAANPKEAVKKIERY